MTVGAPTGTLQSTLNMAGYILSLTLAVIIIPIFMVLHTTQMIKKGWEIRKNMHKTGSKPGRTPVQKGNI